jgi:O-acetyl-ADP-ribose deacetylase (regulator of RNase III)
MEAGCEVVVNASNTQAALGSGVSRAIFDECGGLALQEELRAKLEELGGELVEDDCIVTSGHGSTRIAHVLHVSAVDYRHGGTNPGRIMKVTIAAIEAASVLGKTVKLAFPLLGGGHGGLSPAASMKAMIDGMKRAFRENPEAPIETIVFAVPEAEKHAIAKRVLEQLVVVR